MRDLTQNLLQGALTQHLEQTDFELVGVLPIPSHRDKKVRQQTLQEMIEELDETESSGSVGYFIQIRPKQQLAPPLSSAEEELANKQSQESLYLPHGKLNIPFLFKNASLLMGTGDLASAKYIYKAILDSGESNGQALFCLGRCFETEDQFEEAKNHYEKSIAYLPNLDVFKRLAALYIRQDQNQKAAEIFERALLLKDLEPNLRFELHKACGNCWTRVGQAQKAELQFKQALEINPSADEIRSNLGTVYLQNNQIEDAKRNFRDALASNPKNALALAGLGTCYLAENNKKSAHDYFLQSLAIELHNPTALFHLVKCAFELKTYASATRVLQEYCGTAPVNANLLFSLAGLQFQLGRLQDSKATIKKILGFQPQHQGATELLQRIESYSNMDVR